MNTGWQTPNGESEDDLESESSRAERDRLSGSGGQTDQIEEDLDRTREWEEKKK